MTLKVFSDCSSELETSLSKYIERVFNNEELKTQELIVVDESSEGKELKSFWDEVTSIDLIPPVLFITYSSAEPQGCLEFLKPLIDKWDTWNPTKGVFLRPVLEYLLGIRD